MGHLAFELNVTIVQLRRRIDELQKEVRSWVLRSSQDSTAAMILFLLSKLRLQSVVSCLGTSVSIV